MTHRLRPLQRTLCAALPLLALNSATAWAQTSTAFQPTVLHRFTDDTQTATLGRVPRVPPILGADGLLHGVTFLGGPLLGAFGMVTQGVAYRIDPNGQASYQSTLMGNPAGISTTMVLGSDGQIRAGTYQSNVNNTTGLGLGTSAFYAFLTGAPSLLFQPTLAPQGQLSIDELDQVYIGIDKAIVSCSNGLTAPLLRLNPDNTETKVIDFCHHAQTSGSEQLHPKGSTPVASVWSKADQALYVVTAVDARGVYDSTASADNNGRSVGTLVKISKATLDAGAANNGLVPAEGIEVLHTFLRNRDGQPTAKGGRLTGLVEAGQWLYGTSYANPITSAPDHSEAYSGTVWRVKKGDPSSFTVVHRFRADQANATDGTPNADGGTPHGPLVVAADGNIYGTTRLDGTVVSTTAGLNTPVGAGTLYRIKVGQQADRSDDTYEVLHRFNFGTEGGHPSGLSLGLTSNGIQKVYGANAYGGANEAVSTTGSPAGNGTVFSFDVPVPVNFSTALAASVGSATVGQTITLSWVTENATSCTASGDNGSTWSGAQQVSGNQVQLSAALSKVGVNTFTLRCENSVSGLATEQTVSVNVAASTTTGGSGGGGGGAVGWGGLLAGLSLWAFQSRRRANGRSA
ncbi:MAG: hypothetical protein ACOZE7_05560 [Pseudomonadota bacterium]